MSRGSTNRVYVGLGSNIERESNLRRAIALLGQTFGELILSPVYESAAVGFVGPDFLNLVAGFDSGWSAVAIVRQLHDIENQVGRQRNGKKYTDRTIDLDLLTFGDAIIDRTDLQVPRPEILRMAHVLKPLRDIDGERRHPLARRSYAELWDVLSTTAPRLDVYPLEF